MASPCPITGRVGNVYPRLSIHDLQKNHDQFLLFILSYLILQERTLEAPADLDKQPPTVRVVYKIFDSFPTTTALGSSALEFVELAGIHGLPYQAWKGDPNHDTKADYDKNDPKDTLPSPSRYGGYCAHGSVLFPLWHRPYVLAIEQAIGKVADYFASSLEDSGLFKKERWSTAAKELRFPWWDWAAANVKTDGLPIVLSDEKVTLRIEPIISFDVINPISYYPFKKIPDGFQNTPPYDDHGHKVTAFFKYWMRTFRHAQSSPDAHHSDTEALNRELKKKAAGVRHRVASLFTLPTDPAQAHETYDDFSNHTAQSKNYLHYYNADSLEGVHDHMHDILGGNGHMAFTDYAGFDPIFFLHHCNVDRLYALWEYVYPSEFFIGEYDVKVKVNGKEEVFKSQLFTQDSGTYALVYNNPLSGGTELAPFRRNEKDYWTPNQARNLVKRSKEDYTPKYYTYPAVAGEIKVDQPATPEEREKYRRLLQTYYGVDDTIAVVPAQGIAPPPVKTQGIFRKKNTARIVIGIQTPEFAFNGPYSVQVYYKDQNDTSQYLGSISIFTRQPDSNCANCKNRRQIGSSIRGLLPVPSDIINDVVAAAAVSDLGNVDGPVPTALVDELKSRLSAKILDQFKNEIAVTDGDGTRGALEAIFSPLITLGASYVGHKGEEEVGPVFWDEWADHGEIFQGGWKKV